MKSKFFTMINKQIILNSAKQNFIMTLKFFILLSNLFYDLYIKIFINNYLHIILLIKQLQIKKKLFKCMLNIFLFKNKKVNANIEKQKYAEMEDNMKIAFFFTKIMKKSAETSIDINPKCYTCRSYRRSYIYTI